MKDTTIDAYCLWCQVPVDPEPKEHARLSGLGITTWPYFCPPCQVKMDELTT